MKPAASKAEDIVWSPRTHCPELDGVRGFAILLVTLYRFCRELDPSTHSAIVIIRRVVPAGQYGVDLFFVLSGFLITSILLNTKQKPNYYRNFVARRALRIFPLYFLSLVVGLMIIPALFAFDQFELARQEQVYLWSYTTNIRMSWLNRWCFGPFDHFWSLAVEEHFYLLWPLAVLYLNRVQLLKTSLWLIAIVLIGRTIAATNESMQVAVETLTVFKIDALCMGAVVALLMSEASNYRIERVRAVALMATITPALLLTLIAGKKFLGLPSTFCPAFFALGLFVLLTSKHRSLIAKQFASRWLRFLGRISYGMYVVQLPLVTLLPWSSMIPILPQEPLLQATLYVALMFTATAILALLSYAVVEKPFLRMKVAFK